MTRQQIVNAMQDGPAPGPGPDLAAPLARAADQDAAGARHPGLDRREGDRPRRRAHPRRRRVHQPPREAHEAAVRPDHRLRPRRRQGHPRPRHHASEIEKATPYNTYVIEGLPPGRSPIRAAPPRGGRQSVAHQGSLLRRRRHRAGMPSPKPTTSTSATSPAGGRSRRAARRRRTEIRRPGRAPSGPRRRRPAPSTGGRLGATQDRTAPPPGRAAPRARGRALDASEGTAKDPLLNKTYDLNSPRPCRP